MQLFNILKKGSVALLVTLMAVTSMGYERYGGWGLEKFFWNNDGQCSLLDDKIPPSVIRVYKRSESHYCMEQLGFALTTFRGGSCYVVTPGRVRVYKTTHQFCAQFVRSNGYSDLLHIPLQSTGRTGQIPPYLPDN